MRASRMSDAQERVVRWLDRVAVLTRAHVRFIGWPDGIADDLFRKTLARWCDQRVLTVTQRTSTGVREQFALGHVGRARLRQVYGGVGRARPLPSHARIGNEGWIATRLLLGLLADVRTDLAVDAVRWHAPRRAGPAPRPDGVITLAYHIDRFPLRSAADDHALLLLDRAMPRRTMSVMSMRLFLEIDRGTEFSQALRARIAGWEQVAAELAERRAAHSWARVAWITSGGERRAANLRAIWAAETALPVLITTLDALERAGTLHPWSAHWWDEAGRARTLNPWGGNEPHLRADVHALAPQLPPAS